MLEPIFQIVSTIEDYDLFCFRFKDLTPKEINFYYNNNELITLNLKPKLYHVEKPINLDEPIKSPHIILFLFQCNNKNQYLQDFQEKIKEFIRGFTRPYVKPLFIFLNDPKFTKSKSIFGGFSQFQNFLINEIPDLQFLLIKSSKKISKEDLRKLWIFLLPEISNSFLKRIDFLENITKSLPSIAIIYNFYNLATLFEQICLFKKASECVNEALIFLSNNNNKIFSKFITLNSINLPFDYSKGIDDINFNFFEEPLIEYNIKFLFFKRKIQNLVLINDIKYTIKSGFDFLIDIVTNYNNELNKIDFQFWICTCLDNLFFSCLKEDEIHHNTFDDIYLSILYWLSKELIILKKIILNNQFNNNNFLPLIKICSNDKLFNEKMLLIYTKISEITKNNNYLRNYSFSNLLILKHFNENLEQIETNSLIYFINNNFGYLIQPFTFDQINSLIFNEKILICIKLLIDNKIIDKNVPSTILSHILTDINSPNFYLFINLPIFIKNTNYQKYFEEDENLISFQFIFKFNFFIKSNKIQIKFRNENNFEINLNSFHQKIENYSIIFFKSNFEQKGIYKPISLILNSGNTFLEIDLNNSEAFIYIEKKPNLLNFEIDMPTFLLPDKWQICLIKLIVERDLESIDIIINGIKFKPTPLKLFNGNEIYPISDIIYNNIPKGIHTLYLPIYAKRSGKITVINSNFSISKSMNYSVSQFLELKLNYRELTKVVNLIAFSKSICNIIIQKVDFFYNNELIENTSYGLPFEVNLEPNSALFITKNKVNKANVWVKQQDLESFQLTLDIDIL